MKKRNYTYKVDGKVSQFEINTSNSLRSQQNRYNSLNPSSYSVTTNKKNEEITVSPNIWINQDPDPVAIVDELSDSELKTFSFRCIETIANLDNFDAGQTISEVIENLVKENLPALITLIDEHQIATNRHEEYKVWNKQFMSTVQPLIDEHSEPAKEVALITEQAVHCLERRMFSKYTMETLASRIDCIIESIPSSVEKTGTELQLPSTVVSKLASHVKQALRNLAQ